MPNGEFLIEGIGGSEKEPCLRPACNSLKILSLTTSLFSSADLRLGLDYYNPFFLQIQYENQI